MRNKTIYLTTGEQITVKSRKRLKWVMKQWDGKKWFRPASEWRRYVYNYYDKLFKEQGAE